ncbi:hypothetical protein BC567DRAFT_231645, partial [Phyllosticta citribraziliensis]
MAWGRGGAGNYEAQEEQSKKVAEVSNAMRPHPPIQAFLVLSCLARLVPRPSLVPSAACATNLAHITTHPPHTKSRGPGQVRSQT